eukprot:5239413-Alexandrium_andersonii.AAC.1
MSASLVGSEMCIRDSRCSFQRPTARARHRGPATNQLFMSPHRIASAVAPVSYTHLTLPTICSV